MPGPCGADRGNDRIELFFAARRDCDMRAFRSQQACGLGTESRAAAGDEHACTEVAIRE